MKYCDISNLIAYRIVCQYDFHINPARHDNRMHRDMEKFRNRFFFTETQNNTGQDRTGKRKILIFNRVNLKMSLIYL